MNYFQKNRDKLFPLLAGKWHTKELQEKIIPELKRTNPSKLSYTAWFFFHPSAYWLMYWFAPIVTLICITPALLWAIYRNNIIALIVLGVLFFSLSKGLYTKFKTKKLYPKDYTFYDNWIKTPEDEVGLEIK